MGILSKLTAKDTVAGTCCLCGCDVKGKRQDDGELTSIEGKRLADGNLVCRHCITRYSLPQYDIVNYDLRHACSYLANKGFSTPDEFWPTTSIQAAFAGTDNSVMPQPYPVMEVDGERRLLRFTFVTRHVVSSDDFTERIWKADDLVDFAFVEQDHLLLDGRTLLAMPVGEPTRDAYDACARTRLTSSMFDHGTADRCLDFALRAVFTQEDGKGTASEWVHFIADENAMGRRMKRSSTGWRDIVGIAAECAATLAVILQETFPEVALAARESSENAHRKNVKKPSASHTDPFRILSLIEKLGKLHQSGILTEEEFQAKKTELLKRI